MNGHKGGKEHIRILFFDFFFLCLLFVFFFTCFAFALFVFFLWGGFFFFLLAGRFLSPPSAPSLGMFALRRRVRDRVSAADVILPVGFGPPPAGYAELSLARYDRVAGCAAWGVLPAYLAAPLRAPRRGAFPLSPVLPVVSGRLGPVAARRNLWCGDAAHPDVRRSEGRA